MAGESHPLRHGDIRVVGNHSNPKLAPAVISEEVPILDICFFVEFLTELKGIVRNTLS
jgi:hypothetical protein